ALGVSEKVVDHRDEITSRRFGVGHDETEHGAADDVLAGVAEETLAVVVEKDHPALGIPAQDDRVRPVDDLPVRRLAGAQPGDLVLEPSDLGVEGLHVPPGWHGRGLDHGWPAAFKPRTHRADDTRGEAKMRRVLLSLVGLTMIASGCTYSV